VGEDVSSTAVSSDDASTTAIDGEDVCVTSEELEGLSDTIEAVSGSSTDGGDVKANDRTRPFGKGSAVEREVMMRRGRMNSIARSWNGI